MDWKIRRIRLFENIILQTGLDWMSLVCKQKQTTSLNRACEV